MSDNNRGPYTPQSEAPLAFDARRSNGPGQRPRSGILLISAAVLVVLVVAFVVFALNHVGQSADTEAPKPFDAMKTGPDAGAAPAPDQQKVTIDQTTSPPAPGAQPVFTPPPEQPEARPAAGATPAPTASPTVTTTTTTETAPPPAAKAAAAPKAAPAPVAKAAPVAATPKAAGVSTAAVQIGAYASKALADQAWNDVALSDPAQMAGKTRQAEPVQVNGATSYRSLIGGFSSRAEADAFCDRLKARGTDCFARN